MKQTTLLFLLRDNEILLAMKKRGFGVGRWNGVGGKIEAGESIEQAAARECHEEIHVHPQELNKVARITFTFPGGATDITTHVFVARVWKGEPAESEEMTPKWFKRTDIPYDTMWQDDKYWLPHILEGKKLHASFAFDEADNMLSEHMHINLVREVG